MPTVGEILAAERRRQGKSIADVVDGTKIRAKLLEALEEGRQEELPSPAYVKGYIQSYARYLEIPAEPLLEQHRDESVGAVRPMAPADRYLAEIPAQTLVPKHDRAHEIPRNVWIAVAVGLILVVLALCGIAQLTGRSTGANTTPAAVPTTEPAAVSPGATSTNSATATSTTTTGTGFKLRISIRSGLASYVKVTFDGLTGFDGTMQGGESREFLVTTSAHLTIGKPDAVVVTRDGHAVTVPTTPNASVTLSAAK